ncbi:hypothetical protein NX059_007650 [Plenodomus lindquistii]|nr:hypothetical protein NX059_007650 [Plenodomus lindquistii]
MWLAPSALGWKQAFLPLQSASPCQVPSTIECIVNPGKAQYLNGICDRELESLSQHDATASFVRNFKQTQSCVPYGTEDSCLNRLTLDADESQERRSAQIVKSLSMYYDNNELQDAVAWTLLRELIPMHLHASFYQFELLVSREGPEEAQSAYPRIRSWFQSESIQRAV